MVKAIGANLCEHSHYNSGGAKQISLVNEKSIPTRYNRSGRGLQKLELNVMIQQFVGGGL